MNSKNEEFIDTIERCTIIQLSSDIASLDDLKSRILSKKHKEPLVAKNVQYDSKNPESYFEYKWTNIEDLNRIQTPSGKWLSYIKATANCEYSRKKLYDDQRNLLPKPRRLNVDEISTLFVNKNSRVYAIIFTNDDMSLTRVRALIRNENIVSLDQDWNITSGLFGWMFYKYSLSEKIGSTLEIQEISRFKGKILNDANRFSGKSKLMPDLLVTKAFLSNAYPLTSIGVSLFNDDIPSYIYVNQASNMELRVQIGPGSGANFMFSAEAAEIKVVLYVFFKVIPLIEFSYQNEKENYDKNEKKLFEKSQGIEVIRRIMKRNNISKDEI